VSLQGCNDTLIFPLSLLIFSLHRLLPESEIHSPGSNPGFLHRHRLLGWRNRAICTIDSRICPGEADLLEAFPYLLAHVLSGPSASAHSVFRLISPVPNTDRAYTHLTSLSTSLPAPTKKQPRRVVLFWMRSNLNRLRSI